MLINGHCTMCLPFVPSLKYFTSRKHLKKIKACALLHPQISFSFPSISNGMGGWILGLKSSRLSRGLWGPSVDCTVGRGIQPVHNVYWARLKKQTGTREKKRNFASQIFFTKSRGQRNNPVVLTKFRPMFPYDFRLFENDSTLLRSIS